MLKITPLRKVVVLACSFLAALTAISPLARADFNVIPITGPTLRSDARTHFVIASLGNDLGAGPQLAALTKAMKLQEAFPKDQVVAFIPKESPGQLPWYRQLGHSGAYEVSAKLTTTRLFDELTRFTRIASLHTFGHSAIPEGVFLDAIGTRDVRWYPDSKDNPRLVGHFTEDAFVTLNGCNLGHQMAPYLSKLWGVPVSGALVGTHIEVLTPKNGFVMMGSLAESQWARSGAGLFRDDRSCARGCVRFRPDNVTYTGHYLYGGHKSYTQGLPFYKFFCAGLSEESCLGAMARSIVSTVSSRSMAERPSYDEYAQVVREWLCPTGFQNSNLQKSCIAKLKAVDEELARAADDRTAALSPALAQYSPFSGPTAQCSFESCYAKESCLKTKESAWACSQTDSPPPKATTVVDEYRHYRAAYALVFGKI